MDWDDAYANAPYIPGADAYPDRWAAEAKAFRDSLSKEGRADLGVSYGPSDRQRYDLFHPADAPQGLFVFVHGGYWMKFHRTFWSHFAAGMLAHGWAVAMPSYDLCPEVRISDITGQIARAIPQIAAQVAGPISLAGHSAGGHLVARMCIEGLLPAPVMARVQRVMPISPVSDLRPLINTEMNAAFCLDEDKATAESPALMTPLEVPVTVWVGADERPVFLDQARWLADAWGANHKVEENRHHFDVIDALRDAESAMVRCLLT